MSEQSLTIRQAFELARRQYQAGELPQAETLFRQIIARSPSAEAYFNHGKVLKDLGSIDESIFAYRQAIALRPDLVEAYSNLGTALKESGRLDDALSSYRQSLSLRPDQRTFSNLLYMLWFLPDYDAKRILEQHLAWGRACAASVKPAPVVHVKNDDPNRRLRIGYVSPDFRAHVVGFNLLPLFREHDRENFELFCYSNVAAPDALTEQFRGHAHQWREIRSLHDEQTAALIQSDRIDILVDLSLHMADNRLPLFARKPAPVQVTFGGYPGTTGLPTIQYRLTDPYLDPLPIGNSRSPIEADDKRDSPAFSGDDNGDSPAFPENRNVPFIGTDAHYSERSVRLPQTFWCYQPFSLEPPVNSLPALKNNYVSFGCLNNFCKMNSTVLELWARVLASVPHSRLILMSRPGGHRQRTSEFLASHGVSPDRVRFVDFQPLDPYLRTYHEIDIGLDTFPYNGHTTSLDSCWMGVPVVTLIGDTVVGRAGWSQLSNLGLKELAANEPSQLVTIATELAGDLSRLAEFREGLRDRMRRSPLMDAKAFARGVEAAYRRMFQDRGRDRR